MRLAEETSEVSHYLCTCRYPMYPLHRIALVSALLNSTRSPHDPPQYPPPRHLFWFSGYVTSAIEMSKEGLKNHTRQKTGVKTGGEIGWKTAGGTSLATRIEYRESLLGPPDRKGRKVTRAHTPSRGRTPPERTTRAFAAAAAGCRRLTSLCVQRAIVAAVSLQRLTNRLVSSWLSIRLLKGSPGRRGDHCFGPRSL